MRRIRLKNLGKPRLKFRYRVLNRFSFAVNDILAANASRQVMIGQTDEKNRSAGLGKDVVQ